MEQNILTTIMAIIIYLSTSIFNGGDRAANPREITNPDSGRSQQQSSLPGAVIVTSDLINLRSETAVNSQVVATLGKGTTLSVRSEKDGSYQVTDNHGRTGWVAKWAVTPAYRQPANTGNSREVLGYYAESYTGDSRAMSSFTRNVDTITMVAPFFYRVDQHGNISGQSNEQLIKISQAKGVKILAVVSNISGSNFSRSTVSSMLRSKNARSRAVNGILRLLREKGYSGVNIDFEGVPANDRQYLTAFFRELAAALRPYHLLVTAALPAKTAAEEWSSWAGAYDYKALSPYLDLAVIMTYDQHYASGPAGPVASQPWVESVLQYSIRYISPDRLIMGLAAYGYDWSKRSGKALNYSAIESLLKQYRVAPSWHEKYQTPYFTYTKSGEKHEVWYENRHSSAAKMRLVDKYKLRGAAVWRLGYEDPEIWSVLSA